MAELDLDAIRDRLAALRHLDELGLDAPWLYGAAGFVDSVAALVAEVERLLVDVERLRARLDAVGAAGVSGG